MDNKENQYVRQCNDIFEEEANSAVLYERSRIKALAEEREEVQKKTFTKWVNSHLIRAKEKLVVDDLFSDLRDGKVLLELLQVLSGEKLPKAEKGKMRIHCIENVAKSLQFLNDQRVYLENLGAHDIVDGNQTLILGLIWTIILRYQIQDVQFDEFDGQRTPKDALLLWCQMKTAGYPNINIRNFTTSWKDGLAFNALLHKHNPEVVDYVTLTKANPVENMNKAFNIAEEEFGVPQLLEPTDIIVDHPDEKSVMTYVGALYLALNRMKTTTVQSKRIGKIINAAIDVDNLIDQYDGFCDDLLDWINEKIDWMENEALKGSLPEVKEQLSQFSNYRLNEKPPKFEIRGSLEIKFFEIQSKLIADKRKPFLPTEGHLISDINRAWDELEKAEHRRELKLYQALMKQQCLEQLANRFHRKAQMRKTWLLENDRLVHQDIFGDDLVTVDAAIKKHEALEGDIYAHEERIKALENIVEELDSENYYKILEIENDCTEILNLWEKLLEDLQNRRTKLDQYRDVQVIMHENAYLRDYINDLKTRFISDDFGKHLLGVETLSDMHKILTSDAKNLHGRVNDINDKIENLDLQTSCKNPELVKDKIRKLNEEYADLLLNADERENKLLKAIEAWEYIEDLDNDKEWIKEMCQIMQNPDVGHDLKSVERLIRKHDLLKYDMDSRREQIVKKLEQGQKLAKMVNNVFVGNNLVLLQINDMQEHRRLLDINEEERREKLQNSFKFFQLLADVEDTDALVLEESRIFENVEVGDKLAVTELYVKKYKEQLKQVEDLDIAMNDLLDRSETLPKNQLTSEQVDELDRNCSKLIKDFENLHQLTNQRLRLLEDTLKKFNLMKDADAVDNWIVAKEKFLNTLVPTDELEELNVIKHRFDGFEYDMRYNAQKVCSVNDSSMFLIENEHPDSDTISEIQNNLNRNWNLLADLAEGKKKELKLSLDYNQFLLECQETCSWIKDKMKLLEWTDELKDDLDGIMQRQRRLGSLQTDVQAIEAKVKYLNNVAPEMRQLKPASEEKIDSAITLVNELWEELKIMLQDRDDRLNSFTELQKYLQDLDDFQKWLRSMQIQVATQDIPANLKDAKSLQKEHQEIEKEIESWQPEFTRLLEFGRQVSTSKDDAQYMFFDQRLDTLEEDWESLHKMCSDKSVVLQQSVDAQMFIKDSLQVDKILTNQETFLSKELPKTYDGIQCADRDFENFKSSVAANKPQIDELLAFGETLINNNALSDKIKNKCDQIIERCNSIDAKMAHREHQLKTQLTLHTYTEDLMDLEEWIAEKMIIASDTSYRDAKDISTRYNRFRDFERELEANENRVNEVIQQGNALTEKSPELKGDIEPNVELMEKQWNELMQTAREKSQQMEESNREIIFDESTKSVMSWLTDLSTQIITTEEVTDEIGLVELGEKIKDHDEKDKQLEQKKKMLGDIDDHAEKLKQQYPDREQEFEQIQQEVRVKLTQVEAPMVDRRNKLEQQKRVQQFLRDIEDEKEWIDQKRNLLNNMKVHPDNLQHCLQRCRRLKTVTGEIENHEPRIEDVKREGQTMIEEDHPCSDKFEIAIKELDELWLQLLQVLEECQEFFSFSKEVHEYLTDAIEAEEWMNDREFELLSNEKVKDEDGAQKAMRKHEELTNSINNFATTISDLGDRYQNIINQDLPGSHLVSHAQEKIDKLYATLADMCLERKIKIEDLIVLYRLHLEIIDLEEWIAERTIVASSNETGSELEHCTLLRDRFTEFAKETNEIGGPRVAHADNMCDKLIEEGHQEAAQIAAWKDRVNEAWADLLELIETRIQLLKSTWDFFKFMSDSAELIDVIYEKIRLIPEVVGRDAKTVATYQRKHAAFVAEIEILESSINSAIDTANYLQPLYSSEREDDIVKRRLQLQQLWLKLQKASESRHDVLLDAADLYRFYAMVRELLNWMSEVEIQVRSGEKPKDVCDVELIISNHRSLKAEIDSRDESRSICLTLGRTLMNRKHPKHEEIRQKCREVTTKHFRIVEMWKERQEYLDKLLGVYQFARDAAVAEAWIIAQEPHVFTEEIGDTLPETLNLIQRHQVLERNLAQQEDRFDTLRRPTAFEKSNQSAEWQAQKERDRKERLERLLDEFKTPPPTPKPVHKPIEVIDEIVPVKAVTAAAAIPTSEEDRKSPVSPSVAAVVDVPVGPIRQDEKERTRSGLLNRKHEWEHTTKKASNRGWHELFAVIENGQMTFYKDGKHRDKPYKNERPLDLLEAQASPANSYRKKENVLRLRLKNGAEYLLQSLDGPRDLQGWVEVINAVGGVDVGDIDGEMKYSTLPAPSTQKAEFHAEVGVAAGGGKKKFTTLSRKQK